MYHKNVGRIILTVLSNPSPYCTLRTVDPGLFSFNTGAGAVYRGWKGSAVIEDPGYETNARCSLGERLASGTVILYRFTGVQ